MSLTSADIRRIAHLARLAVTEDELARVSPQLNGILAMIEQMRAVDTAGIEPMAHAVDMVQRLRADQVTEPDSRAAMQAIAPQVDAGLYLVPKVIE